MTQSVSRRKFLLASAACAGAAAVPFATRAQVARPLPLPALVDLTGPLPDVVPLELKASQHDFGTGSKSRTFGINGDYLGPVLKVRNGTDVPFRISNNIGEVTTIHWHGLHIPGNVDGGPHQEIQNGGEWTPVVPIRQSASTNWFHAHTHGSTARQTYHGLAGIMHIEDDASLAADLPKTYGIDDFTLILQDKAFDRSGGLAYRVSGEVFENGFQGDTMVVNGAIAPCRQNVPKGLVRLRLLNACNARFLKIALNSGQPLHVIASDGGFLGSRIETDAIIMSPGERYEILVDLSSTTNDDLMVTFLDGGEEGLLSSIFGSGDSHTALTLQTTGAAGFDGALPQTLANLDQPSRQSAVRTRSFQLNMEGGEQLAALAAAWGNLCGNGGAMGINGLPMNMDRIDEGVRRGDTEIWRISTGEQRHPFHIHGCSFRILSQEGAAPPEYASGWKDMVAVQEGWSEVLVQFNHDADEATPYMYHCHILEHEDCGMMGQFIVSDSAPFSRPAVGGGDGDGGGGGDGGGDGDD